MSQDITGGCLCEAIRFTAVGPPKNVLYCHCKMCRRATGQPIVAGAYFKLSQVKFETHRRYADWSPDRFKRWARSFGPDTEGLIIAILANRPHPEQGFRTCLGVLRLFRGLDRERAEKIAAHAIDIGALTYKSIASIIEHKTERHQQPTKDRPVIDHPNVRGSQYFH